MSGFYVWGLLSIKSNLCVERVLNRVVNICKRKGDVKLCDVALYRVVGERYRSAHRGDNLVADGKPQARALLVAGFLADDEWFKDIFARIFRNAATVVCEFDLGIVAVLLDLDEQR